MGAKHIKGILKATMPPYLIPTKVGIRHIRIAWPLTLCMQIIKKTSEIVSEYDQKITQSQTAICRQTHATARKRDTTITKHQEDKLSKATSWDRIILYFEYNYVRKCVLSYMCIIATPMLI